MFQSFLELWEPEENIDYEQINVFGRTLTQT